MKIAILGGGISGLSAAWFAKKKYGNRAAIILYEKSHRVGGWIHTTRQEGFLFEKGPRGFRSSGNGRITLELIRELGIEKELCAAKATSRYIWLQGRLQKFTPLFLLKQGLLVALFRDWWAKPSSMEDETIASFVERRLSTKIKEHLFDPLVKGIFGGDVETLSMKRCLPTLWNWEKEHGSIAKGFFKTKKESSSIYSFQDGMERLPQALAEKIDAQIILSHPITNIYELDADLVISTLPIPILCHLLDVNMQLPFATLTTIHCGWYKPILKQKGFGFLVPSLEKSPLLGMTFDSEIFPRETSQTILCLMVKGKLEEVHATSFVRESLAKYLNVHEAPDLLSLSFAEEAIPQYPPFYDQKLQELKSKLPKNLLLLGAGVSGIGVNDAIFHASKLFNF